MPKLLKMKDLPERMIVINEPNTKHIPKLGDIFTFSINPGEYMFGRIIFTELKNESYWGHVGDGNIIYYFYNIKSNIKNLEDFSILSLDKLLTGPIVSYKDYFQLGYFEVIGNEKITNKNVHFPICFENRIYSENNYRDQDDNIIEKQDICGKSGLYNIFGIQSCILSALGEPITESKYDKEKFRLFDTNAGFDYGAQITGEKKPDDLYKKINIEEYYKKNYDFDSYDALEVMVDIEVLIFTYLKRELEIVDEDLFPGIYEFWNKYGKENIDKNIFIKAKKLLEVILKSKTSELKGLWQDSGRYKFLKKWIEKRVLLIEKILEE
ncbi:MAG: Imm26 family immunity protein [Candidatus Absconditabacteria bacterium]